MPQVLQEASDMAQARTLYTTAPIMFPQRPAYKVGRNLKQRLTRASVEPFKSLPHGCFSCNEVDCPICITLVESTVVNDATSPLVYSLHQHLTCNSRNVVYRVRCKQCNIFGIGECEFPKQRLMDYVRAAASNNSAPSAVLDKHFADSLHSTVDLVSSY